MSTDPTTLAGHVLADIDPTRSNRTRPAPPEATAGEQQPSTDRTTGQPSEPGLTLDALRIDWRTFWTEDQTDAQWLIEPVLAAGRNHSITAAAKTGKSLFVLAAVTPAVLGQAALDRPAGEPLRVLYLDYEMSQADVQERLVDMGHGPEFTPETFAYLLHPPIPPLDTEAGGLAVKMLAEQHRADLVVIDTYSRAVAGEEDGNDTVRDLYRCTITPLKAQGIAVLRLDHTGHKESGRARGASAKADDVDLGWLLTRSDSGFRLKANQKRAGWMPDTVNIAVDSTPLRARVVAGSWPHGTTEAADQLDTLGIPLGASQRAARDALKSAGLTMTNEVMRAALKYRRTLDRGPS